MIQTHSLYINHGKPLQRGRRHNPFLTGREDKGSDTFNALCARFT